jgi:hypothetical protein
MIGICPVPIELPAVSAKIERLTPVCQLVVYNAFAPSLAIIHWRARYVFK